MIFEEFDRIDGKPPTINKHARFQNDAEAQQIAQLRRQNAELHKLLQNKQQPQQSSSLQTTGQPKKSKLLAPRSYKLHKKSNSFDSSENQRSHSVLMDAPYATFMTEKSQLRLRAMSNQDDALMPDPLDDRYIFQR